MKAWVFRWMLVLVSALLFVLVDIGAYFILPRWPEFLNKSQFTWDSYRTNPRGYFKESKVGADGNVYFTIFRSNQRTNGNGKKIVVAIGDSFTYGQGVYPRDTFVHLVSRENKEWSSVNLGVSGQNVMDSLQQIKDWKGRADLVVYGYNLTDPVVDNKSMVAYPAATLTSKGYEPHWDMVNVRTPHILAARGRFIGGLSNISNIVNGILSYIEMSRHAARTVSYYNGIHSVNSNAKGLGATFEAIKQMQAEAKVRGGKFVVVLFPMLYSLGDDHPFLDSYEVVKDGLERLGIDVIQLYPKLKNFKDSDLWVESCDQHPNERVHAIVGDEILKYISERHI